MKGLKDRLWPRVLKKCFERLELARVGRADALSGPLKAIQVMSPTRRSAIAAQGSEHRD